MKELNKIVERIGSLPPLIEANVDFPIRVCFVSHSAEVTGGAECSLLDMLDGFDKTCVSPFVLLPGEGPLCGALKARNVPIKIIPNVGPTKVYGIRNQILVWKFNTLAALRMSQFFREKNIQIVHINCFVHCAGMDGAKLAGIPYICHIREMVREHQEIIFQNERVQNRRLKNADFAIYISQCVKEKYARVAPRTPYAVLHDGISIEKNYAKHNLLFQAPQCRLLMVGNFSEGKGQIEAIRAAEFLVNWGLDIHLTFVGGGDPEYRKTCVQEIARLKLNGYCTLLDFTDELRALRGENDIVLVCSRYEALGRVTIEGMLAGCLVVGANTGATLELLGDGTRGFLYNHGNPENLAEVIQYALQHVDEANAIAEAGQTWALKHFDHRNYAREIVSIYKEILKRSLRYQDPAGRVL